MDRLTIGEVAKHAHVRIETLRYYERMGLVAPPPRNGANYRLYPPDTVRHVQFIKQIMADLDLAVTVAEVPITTPEDAQNRRFLGSPTVLVNGRDIDPNARQQTRYGLSCRVYPGMARLPPEDMIRAALQSPHPPV
jgi:hypothetical protein